MKLVMFHPAFDAVGGAELLVAQHASCFRSAGHDVRLVTFAFNEHLWAPRLSGIQVDVVERPMWMQRLAAFDDRRKLELQVELASRALSKGERVIAYNYPCSSILGKSALPKPKFWQCNEPPRGLHVRAANPTLAARVSNGPPSASLFASRKFKKMLNRHDRDERRRSGPFKRRMLDVETSHGLDLIYAISEFARDNARAIYGRCDQDVVYPVVPFPRAGRTRAGLDRSGLKVLVHSRLELLKNVDTVVRGFQIFRASHRCPVQLHIVGTGPARGALQRLARRLGLGDSVRFHGFLPEDELNRVYDACDVFALLPLDEPFGMVFPEAAARGLLLIGSSHGGPKEILDDGRFGWTVDAFSPEALAAALDEVWRLSDAEADRRRRDAHAACVSRYSRETLWPQLNGLLERAL